MTQTKSLIPVREYAWFVEPAEAKVRSLNPIVQLEAARMDGASFAGLVIIDDVPAQAIESLHCLVSDYDDLAQYCPTLMLSDRVVVPLYASNVIDALHSAGLQSAGLQPAAVTSADGLTDFALDGRDPAELANSLLSSGQVQLLLTSPAIAGSAPLPTANTLVDLSSATGLLTAIRANLLTGGSASHKSMHVWTVTAIGPGNSTDFERLASKHAMVWGLTRDGEQRMVQGLDHVLDYRQRKHLDELLSGGAPARITDINTSTLNALQSRNVTAREWLAYTPLPEVTPELLIEEPQEATGLRLTQSVNFAVTVLYVILIAVAVRFAFQGNLLGIAIPALMAALNYPVIMDIGRTVKNSASSGAQFSAVFRVLEASSANLGRSFDLPFVHLVQIRSARWVRGESEKLHVTIKDREPRDCQDILGAAQRVLSPVTAESPWVLEAARTEFTVTRSLVWFVTLFFHVTKPRYFALPKQISSAQAARAFVSEWERHVGPCRLTDSKSSDFALNHPGCSARTARIRDLA